MLNEKHLNDLRKSGLNDDTIQKLGFFSADRDEVKSLLRLEYCKAGGMVIPYPGFADYYRAKNDEPTIEIRPDGTIKEKDKYLSQRGGPNHFYILDEVRSIMEDVTKPLIITEGEKKAAKACQEGFPTLGLGGVSSWWVDKAAGRAAPEFDVFRWMDAQKGSRLVYLIFDSDQATNKNVNKSLIELKDYLKNVRFANAIIRFLPSIPGHKNIGLDDFLVIKGNDALRKLLELNPIMPDVNRSHDIEKIVKIGTKPPKYQVHVGGKVLDMSYAELISFDAFEVKAGEELDDVVDFEKPKVYWKPYIKALLQNGSFTVKAAPQGSSNTDPVVNEIKKLLSGSKKSLDEFQAGEVLDKGEYLFVRGEKIITHVTKIIKNMKSNDIYYIAHNQMGGEISGVRVKPGPGGVRSAWRFPKSVLDDTSVDDSVEEVSVVNGDVPDDF